MAVDYYKELGVDKTASEKDIKSAFRKLARQYHPDVNGGDPQAEARFKRINEAYEVVGDADNRKKYDKYGENWMHADEIEKMQAERTAAWGNFDFDRGGGGGGGGGQTYTFRSSPGGGFSGFSGFGGGGPSGGAGAGAAFDPDILADLFGGGGGPQRPRSGARPGSTAKARGRDIEHPVSVSLTEAMNGTTRMLTIGETTGEVRIPAGVTNGSRVKLAGRGGPGVNGGAAGDLILVVSVTAQAPFEIRGDDIEVDVAVMAPDAALGAEVSVPAPGNKRFSLKVPAGTSSGKKFRLAGKGMPRVSGGHGDLIARVMVTVPSDLTEREQTLYRELQAIREWQR